MAIKKNVKKCQSLPLNTIVISILVILVLLVIIVVFTGNSGKVVKIFSEKGDLEDCSMQNPSIQGLDYSSVKFEDKDACANRKGEVIKVIPANEEGYICCGFK